MAVAEGHRSTRVTQIKCRDCQISFLTASSNRGRPDIRCPLGCRQQHSKEGARERSTKYNQSAAGKAAKKKHNRRRNLRGPGGLAPKGPKKPTAGADKASELTIRERYYRWLIYLIDGILTNQRELRLVLDSIFTSQMRKVRQQGPDKRNEVRDNRDD